LQTGLEQFAVVVGEQFVETLGVEFLFAPARGAANEVAVVVSFEFGCHNRLLPVIAKAGAKKGHHQIEARPRQRTVDRRSEGWRCETVLQVPAHDRLRSSILTVDTVSA
jgi:hypothetical protein